MHHTLAPLLRLDNLHTDRCTVTKHTSQLCRFLDQDLNVSDAALDFLLKRLTFECMPLGEVNNDARSAIPRLGDMGDSVACDHPFNVFVSNAATSDVEMGAAIAEARRPNDFVVRLGDNNAGRALVRSPNEHESSKQLALRHRDSLELIRVPRRHCEDGQRMGGEHASADDEAIRAKRRALLALDGTHPCERHFGCSAPLYASCCSDAHRPV